MTDSLPPVVIVRHAEKPAHGGPHGVDHHGNQTEHGLTPRGWTRTGALAVRFAHSGAEDDPIPRPSRVYATATDAHHASDRPRMTATPIAQRLDVHLHDHHGRGSEAQLAAEILAAGEPTLIVWDHGHIPTLARAFPMAAAGDIPESWPDDRFDLFWVLVPDADGHYSLRILAQELLAGDANT